MSRAITLFFLCFFLSVFHYIDYESMTLSTGKSCSDINHHLEMQQKSQSQKGREREREQSVELRV